MSFDILIRGATVVGADEQLRRDVGVADGVIAAIGPELAGRAHEEIDATGLHLFPGVIDAHVHFNEPGRAEWEGFATARARSPPAAPPATIEMPLNAHPPTVDAAASTPSAPPPKRHRLVDFALWGGLVPATSSPGGAGRARRRRLQGLHVRQRHRRLRAADDLTLYEGMCRAPPARAASSPSTPRTTRSPRARRRAPSRGRTAIRDYLASRPVVAELEAISRAILFAERDRLRAAHRPRQHRPRRRASSPRPAGRGVDVSCETCPHYLVLTDEDVERIGALAKCAPPIRSARRARRALARARRRHAADGRLGPLARAAAMKTGPDFFNVWGGISGCQTTAPTPARRGPHARGPRARLMRRRRRPARPSASPARDASSRARAPTSLLDRPALRRAAQDARPLLPPPQSPFVGRTLRGRIARTLLRGRTVFGDGRIVGGPAGRLLIPTIETERP